MPRTKAIFDWIFNLNPAGYQLFYLESPDVGLSEDALHARYEKEKKSLESIKIFSATFRNLKHVWEFLNVQHDLYTSSKLVQRGKQTAATVEELVKKSYGGKR